MTRGYTKAPPHSHAPIAELGAFLAGAAYRAAGFPIDRIFRGGVHRRMIPSVLIVDDEKHTREGLLLAFEDNYDVSVAGSADEAFNLLDTTEFDVIVTDLRMPGKSGLKVIDKALTLPNKPVVIMMTAYGNLDSAVEAM